ncbi:MAG: choice-of-anchor D domain-containing protein [Cyclobacteriaceae bacterium]
MKHHFKFFCGALLICTVLPSFITRPSNLGEHSDLTSRMRAFTLLVTESFDTDGEGSRYRSNAYQSPNGNDFWIRTNVSPQPGSSNNQTFSGWTGSHHWNGEDIDDDQNPLGELADGYVVLQTLDVSSYTSGKASVTLQLAAEVNGSGNFETDDFFYVEYAFDGDAATGANSVGGLPSSTTNVATGTYAVVGAFYGTSLGPPNKLMRLDADLNGTGEGTALSNTFTDFTFEFDIPAAASNMSIRLRAATDGGGEVIAFDNIRVSAEPGGPSASPEINVKQSTTDITSGGSFGFGSVQIGDSKDVVFTVENTGDAALDITSITPSGTGFSISSAISADPIAASSSATFKVRFQPTATSQTSGSVTIASDDADEASYVINFTASVTDATLSLKVFLEGPLSGTTMSTAINSALPADPTTVYSGVVGETSSGIPGTVIDWVEVELRIGTAASTKVGTNRAGLLHSDGSITDKDGNPFTMSQVDGNSYYIAIHHRNHLSVMSANTVSPSGGTYTYDFTDAQNKSFSNGSDGATQVGSVFTMMAGDADANNTIGITDLSAWRGQNGAAFTYSSNGGNDLNLDGVINAVDRNDFQQPNSGKSSQVPN